MYYDCLIYHIPLDTLSMNKELLLSFVFVVDTVEAAEEELD